MVKTSLKRPWNTAEGLLDLAASLCLPANLLVGHQLPPLGPGAERPYVQCEIGIVPKTVFPRASRWPRCLSERTGMTSGSPSSISATKKEATDEKGDNHIILMQKPIHSFHPRITQSRFPGRITERTLQPGCRKDVVSLCCSKNQL